MALREAILLTRATHPFSIEAWVLLPDHLHCIWTLPDGDADFPVRWAMIKRYVSKTCSAQYGAQDLSGSRMQRRESGLWQRRFWEHLIRDDADFERHADYIHWNPVNHGLVQGVCDWSHSTFHRFVQDGKYTNDWGLAASVLDISGE